MATGILVTLSTLTGVLMAVIGVLIGQVVGNAAATTGPSHAGTFVGLVGLLVLCLAVSSVLPMFAQAMSTRLSDRIVEDTTLRLADAVSGDVTLTTLENPETLGAVRRVQQRQWEIKGGGRQLVGPAWQLVLAVGSCAAVLATILPWWIPLLLVVAWVGQVAIANRSLGSEMDLIGRNVEGAKARRVCVRSGYGGRVERDQDLRVG